MEDDEGMDVERLIRDAYQAGEYAADYAEGKVWKRRPTDPDVEPPESEDQVVARLLREQP